MITRKRLLAAAAFALVAAVIFVLCPKVCAQSKRGTVAIVRVDDDDKLATQVLMRLGAELTAAGFAWVFVDQANGLGGSLRFEPWALVMVSVAPEGFTVEIGLPANEAQGVEARRLVSIGESTELTPTELALRTVEVLRAHLEGGPHNPAPPSPPLSLSSPAPAVRPLVKPASPRVWQAQAAVGAMRGTQGLTLGLGPAAALVTSKASMGVRAAFASSIWHGEAQGADSPAKVSQWLFMTDVLLYLRAKNVRVRPYVAIGAGVLHMNVNASRDGRLFPTDASRLAVAGKASLGAEVELGTPRLHLISEAGLVATTAAMVIEVSGPKAGIAGRPTQFVQIGLSWRL